MHASAALARWQDVDRREMKRRLKYWGREEGQEGGAVENVGFVEDGGSEDDEEDEIEGEDDVGLARDGAESMQEVQGTAVQ